MNHRAKKVVFFVSLLLFFMITGLPTNVEAAKNKGKCSLQLSSTPSSASVQLGDSVTYNYSLKNVGTTPCADASISVYYADNEMYTESSPAASASNYYWYVGALARNQAYQFSVTIKNIPNDSSQVYGEACGSATGANDACVSTPVSLTPVNIISTTTPPLATTNIQTWVYPGYPACGAPAEYSDGRHIDTLKPEYYTVQSTGALRQLTVSIDGCNGYSANNAADIKAHSDYQYVTVSGNIINVRKLLASSALRSSAITTLTDFVVANDFTGVEIDWEGFGDWTATDYANYKNFVTALQNNLHAHNKSLIIDAPAIADSVYQGYFPFKYEDFTNIDYVAIMTYDYQYDYGVGQPVAPEAWVANTINWAKARLDTNKIIIGLPSYGYHGVIGSYNIIIDTYEQSATYPGYSSRQLNADGEEAWTYGGTYYVAQAASTLNQKKALVESMGIKNISVWHLGGNLWFTNN